MKKRPGAPATISHDVATQEQVAQQERDRRQALFLVLDLAVDADDLVTLAAALELDEELDELAGTSSERQRLLRLARARLAETAGSLADG